MKKLSIIFAVLLIAATLMPLASSAASWQLIENPTISVPKVTPTIDGTIKSNEGWSSTAYLNEDTGGSSWRQNPLTITADIRFAYDDNGLYYSADIVEMGSAYVIRVYRSEFDSTYVNPTNGQVGDYVNITDHDAVYADPNAVNYKTVEDTPAYSKYDPSLIAAHPSKFVWTGNSFIYSTDYDDIDLDYGFNGDVFVMAFDPIGKFSESQYLKNDQFTQWYCVGLFEGDEAKMYRTKINDGDITDKVKVEGKKTAKGWCFEAFIPWELIVEDTNAVADSLGGLINGYKYTKEDLLANTAKWRLMAMYMDRFYDEEAGMNDTWGRFATTCTTTPDGESGLVISGCTIRSYGLYITLNVPKTNTNTNTSTTGNSNTNTSTTSNTNSNTSTSSSGPAGTTAGPKTGNPTGNNGDDNAGTFDLGIAISVGTLSISAIGIYFTKKNKEK